jgi:ribose-phosphate pyrophosphokinase
MSTAHILSTMQDGIVIIASGPIIPMAKRVVERLRKQALPIEFQELEVKQFNYPEKCFELADNVRGKTVFLFHGYTHDPDGDFMKMQLLADAIRRSSARSITIITPFLPYTRQDRLLSRGPFSAKLIAQMIEVNPKIEQLVTVDLHAPQIAGFFNNIHVENIPGHALFVPFVREKFATTANETTLIGFDDKTAISTDVGGAKRAREFAEHVGLGVAIVDKRRGPDGSEALSLVGSVNRVGILYDDIGDTVGSLVNAAEIARKNGTEKVYAIVSHGLLSKKGDSTAEKKLRDANIRLIMSDSFPRSEAYLKRNKHIVIAASDGLMADIISALISVNGSVKSVIKHWTAKQSMEE